MSGLIYSWLINTLALALTAWLIPGIQVSSIFSALFAALLLGIVNAVVRPVLILLTLPLTLLTLGLFTLVINGLMLYMVSGFVDGFQVSGFGAAVLGSLVLALFNTMLGWLFKDKN